MWVFVSVVSYNRVSLCDPGCPGPHSVDQASLELTQVLPAFAFQVLELKVCPTTSRPLFIESVLFREGEVLVDQELGVTKKKGTSSFLKNGRLLLIEC